MPGPSQPVPIGAVDGALQLSVPLPARAVAVTPAPLDLSSAPGVQLDLHRAWRFAEGARLELACVHAPADRWGPGLESAVLDGASATVRKAGGFAELTPASATPHGHGFEQLFQGRTAAGVDVEDVHGRHLLGFAGKPKQVALCTVACVDSASSLPKRGEAGGAGPGERCAELVAGVDVDGWLPPPPPGPASRLLGWTLQHPVDIGAGLAAGVLLLIAVLLRFRPRPTP